MILLDVAFNSNGEFSITSKADTNINSFLKERPEDLSFFDVFTTLTFNQYQVYVGD